jgi:Fur family ferric uptake transcriptional regulator/Fur family peroxide stress response transcriptional regulator
MSTTNRKGGGGPRAARRGRTDASIDDLVALLRQRGHRVTSQRLVILRALRRHGGHATAEEIHRAVRSDLPGTSTPTVYAALDLLVELGLARKLDLGLGVALYDARTDAHQHAVCRRCGRIEDLDLELDPRALLRDARGPTGFEPRATELVISGLCAECAAATA